MGRGLFISCVVLGLFATNAEAGGSLGAEAGVHLAYGSTGSNAAGGPRVGMMAGATLEVALSRLIALRSGFRYAQKGARAELMNLFGLRIEGTLSLDAIDVPLQLALRYPMRRVTPFALFGPVASLIVSKSFEVDTFTFIRPDIRDRFASFDLGLATTVGCEFALTAELALSLWGRFDYGLLDIDKSPSQFATRVFATGLATAFRF